MKSSPTLRVFMAAGLYLLLLWGYVYLQTPQLFAAFEALVLSVALLFWVSEAREYGMQSGSSASQNSNATQAPCASDLCDKVSSEPSVRAANLRLDSLKADLMDQYAQFGRDQSSLTSKGLGTWQQKRGQRGEDGS